MNRFTADKAQKRFDRAFIKLEKKKIRFLMSALKLEIDDGNTSALNTVSKDLTSVIDKVVGYFKYLGFNVKVDVYSTSDDAFITVSLPKKSEVNT